MFYFLIFCRNLNRFSFEDECRKCEDINICVLDEVKRKVLNRFDLKAGKYILGFFMDLQWFLLPGIIAVWSIYYHPGLHSPGGGARGGATGAHPLYINVDQL